MTVATSQYFVCEIFDDLRSMLDDAYGLMNRRATSFCLHSSETQGQFEQHVALHALALLTLQSAVQQCDKVNLIVPFSYRRLRKA